MSKTSVLKVIAYSCGMAVAASSLVLLFAMVLLGFQLNQWAEWEGRIVGAVGTIAGVAGAFVGMSIGLRTESRTVK